MTRPANATGLPCVVHVVPYYPPDRVGGVGEHVRVIHEGHLAMGLDTSVIASGHTETDANVHRVARSIGSFFFNSWRPSRQIGRCDVLQAHHGEGLLAVVAARLRLKRPRVLTMFHVDVRKREKASDAHCFEGRRFGPRGWRRMIQFALGRIKALVDWAVWILADAVVVETEAVETELSSLRPRRPVTVIPHGLGPAPVSQVDRDPVELLYVGTPGIRKRTHLLPSVLYRVREKLPWVRLRIVGFGSDGDPYLKGEAERLGVFEAIEFVGSILAEDVPPFYRSAQVLVLPSAYEGLPMVLLEAMREGLVPVATRVSGHPEAIDDRVNGFLVPLDDVEAMAVRCVEALESPELAATLSDAARRTVASRFSLQSELDRYVELYRTLLA